MQVNGFTCNIAGSRASSTPRTGRNHTPTSRKPTHNNTKESGLNTPTQTRNFTPRLIPNPPRRSTIQLHRPDVSVYHRGGLHFGRNNTPRHEITGTKRGNCIIRGATRRRHADRTLLMLQTPHRHQCGGHRRVRRTRVGASRREAWLRCPWAVAWPGRTTSRRVERSSRRGWRAGGPPPTAQPSPQPQRNPTHSRSATQPTAAAQPNPQPQRNPAHSRSAARPTAAAQPRISQHSRWHRRGRRAGGPPPTGASSSPTQHGTQREAARPHRDQAAHASGDSCQKPRISQHSRRHRRGHRRR